MIPFNGGFGSMNRQAYLESLLGRPWSREQSCWHLAKEVQLELFQRELPEVILPEDVTWSWMIRAIDSHPERERWQEVKPTAPGLVPASDGALVAMARAERAAHIGVWLAPERRVLHCDELTGVVAQPVSLVRAAGWNQARFYELRK